ncbi:FAA hydrolase family protein [Acinetobacter halotolerans]|uniref:FAA hydrolase family protein n=1 Tax=Acinetobacter halotolerans TaxID=1752076 RepID=A0A4Q6XBE2_9GAMM|nr:fumarylacetoacetate hydrolase family protein [Acinetobacter halotolerans]RZF55662.1 FAA hydrolase family protein [Acinetobacter halotolerans]
MSIHFTDGVIEKINNVYCIGRNYSEHIKELGNQGEDYPVVFLKTNTSIVTDKEISLPDASFSKDIHHEVELVIYIDENIDHISEIEALSCIGGYAIGLDFTARDLQSTLKMKGLPWTLSKSFKNSGWVSDFTRGKPEKEALIELYINDELRQIGSTKQMIFPITYLISYLSQIYGLRKGDIIFTGTPAGVGNVKQGDCLKLILNRTLNYGLEII